MSNIRSLSDIKKDSKPPGGRGGPPQGGPPGGGFPGFPGFPGHGAQQPNEKRVKFLRADGQLKEELAKAGGKLVVVDFTASWYV